MIKRFFLWLGRILSAINPMRSPSAAEMQTMAEAYLKENALAEDEKILEVQQTSRAKYDVRFVDSNIFYLAWVVFTTKRIIIAYNKLKFHAWKEIDTPCLSNAETSAISFSDKEKIEIKIRASSEKYILYFENGRILASKRCRTMLESYRKTI